MDDSQAAYVITTADRMTDEKSLDVVAEFIVKTDGDAINATPSRIYQYMESEAFSAALGLLQNFWADIAN